MILAPNFKICESVFNLNAKEVSDRIDFTNEYYGSDDPHGSRILFVNGKTSGEFVLRLYE